MQNRGIDMGKTNPRNANGNARRKLRARLKAEGRPCHLCGLPINYSLPAGGPWSFEVDELVPVSRGGDPLDYSNVDAAHRICNQRRGNRMDGDEGAKGLPIVRSRLF
jgi:5-methylcytosine-specific restriction endonuclease McrA